MMHESFVDPETLRLREREALSEQELMQVSPAEECHVPLHVEAKATPPKPNSKSQKDSSQSIKC